VEPRFQPPTLSELGLGKKESSAGQTLARLKEDAPDLHEQARSGKLSAAKARAELKRREKCVEMRLMAQGAPDGMDRDAWKIFQNDFLSRTGGQRAICGAKATALRERYEKEAAERRKRKPKKSVVEDVPQQNSEPGKTRDQIGKLFDVSGQTIDHARRVLADAVPEVVGAVEEGRMGVSAAAILSTEPEEVQRREAESKRDGRRPWATPKPPGSMRRRPASFSDFLFPPGNCVLLGHLTEQRDHRLVRHRAEFGQFDARGVLFHEGATAPGYESASHGCGHNFLELIPAVTLSLPTADSHDSTRADEKSLPPQDNKGEEQNHRPPACKGRAKRPIARRVNDHESPTADHDGATNSKNHALPSGSFKDSDGSTERVAVWRVLTPCLIDAFGCRLGHVFSATCRRTGDEIDWRRSASHAAGPAVYPPGRPGQRKTGGARRSPAGRRPALDEVPARGRQGRR
jgi:hypothetical protein